jgi:oxygen-independent coproporphyrinogen-3 oxidase
MAGLYIHIPFCKQACTYCDFHFSTQQKFRQPLLKALQIELYHRLKNTTNKIDTVYIGGGSPSILDDSELAQIFSTISEFVSIQELSEITLETNPDDHDFKNLRFWKKLGVNRLSIGIQSFFDRDLKFMNRAHNAEHAEQCVIQAKEAGFESLTIDLIYGVPNQSFYEWQTNVAKAIALNVDHISAYCLTVEERTALHHQVKAGKTQERSDEEIERQYLWLRKTLESAGFEHYELSNFAKPGKYAVHNKNYWSGNAYIGIGPSAHSFDGDKNRRWNVANNTAYIKLINANEQFWEEETLSETSALNEKLITGLRTKEGVFINETFGMYTEKILKSAQKFERNQPDLLLINGNHLGINPDNWLLTDLVLRNILID